MTTKNLSEETKEKIVKPNPIDVITLLGRHRLAILFKIYLQEGIAILKSCHEKRPMDVHGWVFKLYGRFCVCNIAVSIALFNSFYLPTISFTMNSVM